MTKMFCKISEHFAALRFHCFHSIDYLKWFVFDFSRTTKVGTVIWFWAGLC